MLSCLTRPPRLRCRLLARAGTARVPEAAVCALSNGPEPPHFSLQSARRPLSTISGESLVRAAPTSLQPYLRLMRLDKPIGEFICQSRGREVFLIIAAHIRIVSALSLVYLLGTSRGSAIPLVSPFVTQRARNGRCYRLCSLDGKSVESRRMRANFLNLIFERKTDSLDLLPSLLRTVCLALECLATVVRD